MITDAHAPNSRVAELIALIRANAEAIEGQARCRIEVACSGASVHFRLLPAVEPVLDVRRSLRARAT